ncbi:uncharacterized protein LOC127137916 [Lathyrus oleraceus]|uniref:uncharacterized protein LOC127137916 n=1 Tax=Pisum sativum TaxID=3888 RepID=UPI0021D31413|nr:uncharacterized protein LOC127137916 [Pisum sativum]
MVVANVVNNNERDHYSDKPPIFDGNNIARSSMTDQQKKDFKNHHKDKTIFLNIISYTEYEKITNSGSAKSIFDSLRLNLEGNAQLENDLNSICLEELIGSLKSHEIELEEDEPQKRGKSVALKSKPEKIRAYQDEEEREGYDEESDDDDDDDQFSLISKRVNGFWKHEHNGQGIFKGARMTIGCYDSSSGQKKQGFG